MNWLSVFIGIFIGFVLGLLVSIVFRLQQAKTAKELAEELFHESEAQKKANIDAILENIKASFGTLSFDALSKSTEEFLKLAKSRLESEREISLKELDGKKGLIDQQLQQMTSKLENVSTVIKELEKDRVEKFGQLTNHLNTATQQTTALMQTTSQLREALASTKVRGQWGERMAEDVLRLAGFIENVNYLKEKTIEGAGSRPDFTFFLPGDLKLNMDVKFPLTNYIKFLETDVGPEKVKFRSDFLKDVKARIKEVTSREYINPEQNTLDYVLLFIPNEQVYSFIHEQDSSILDEGLKNKVIFCSPITLFAVLAVIRQSVDNFALEKTSNEILSLFGVFKKQWDEFLKKLDILGKRIEDTQKEYESLATTRRRQLERPLNKIDDLREQKGILISSDNNE
ncbi:MAG: DNA recombination protein RmuC [Deltaproteobacteria bacterium]|nr:DNA recombination protein RmuC [Deltaproteobacteria bacterium]OQY17558.1 MAG: recombinase RmuC [Desulfobacterium sp. 4572_20]HDH87549.1 DNA recombination protein RmuC [Desulfobacteraceae bacterium]MBW2105998.1 DNA recombination protein RmuC [Deltaproteobacteria bacterium]RLB15366.1 MAG: DNA recombination protein RmuC [Deltaproteobacteria bacterium]